jgi:nucleoside-diphosphate-sugar epimerase
MLQSLVVTSLVFGIGYIGSRLVQDLLYEGCDVVGVDNFFATDRRAVDGFTQTPSFHFVEGSIADSEAIGRAFDDAGADIEAVYILAAQASAHPDAAPAAYTEEVNLSGPRLIAEALLRRRVDAPIVYGSSLRALGSPLPMLVDESTPYGIFADLAHLSKCYVEKLLEMYAATRGATCRAVRLGLTYGVAPVMKVDPKFMTAPNLFCFQAARQAPLEVRTGHPLGLIHVEDAARALRWAAEREARPGYVKLNAPADVTTVAAIAELVQLQAGARELVVEIRRDTNEGDEQLSLPTLRSAMTTAGFSTRRAIEEGLAETLDHFLVRDQ